MKQAIIGATIAQTCFGLVILCAIPIIIFAVADGHWITVALQIATIVANVVLLGIIQIMKSDLRHFLKAQKGE